jgi:hypothetical protein
MTAGEFKPVNGAPNLALKRKVNPMTITKVLNVLKEDRATGKSPTRARRSKAEDEH